MNGKIEGEIGEFHIGTLGFNLPDGFEYDISMLYNSLTMPIRFKIAKKTWVDLVNGTLDKDDSKCEQYIDFLDNLYSEALDSMGGIGGKLSKQQIEEIFTEKIQSNIIHAIINLIHFKKIPDDDFNGFIFFRVCKKEDAHKNAELVLDSKLLEEDNLARIMEHLNCFNCQCSKHYLEMKKCGKCYNVCYCSKKCQKEHWKIHKKKCKASPNLSKR